MTAYEGSNICQWISEASQELCTSYDPNPNLMLLGQVQGDVGDVRLGTARMTIFQSERNRGSGTK